MGNGARAQQQSKTNTYGRKKPRLCLASKSPPHHCGRPATDGILEEVCDQGWPRSQLPCFLHGGRAGLLLPNPGQAVS